MNAAVNQGEFHARVPRSSPMTTGGVGSPRVVGIKRYLTIRQHAPGVKVGNDAVPEFSAQTLPAGTAPPKHTFQQSPIPGENMNPDIASEVRTPANEAMSGATSGDVHRGLGQPVWGQSSHELRGDGKGKHGLAGVGADPRDSVRERALDIDTPKDTRGKGGISRYNIPGAEERLPETAESVAAAAY